MLRQRNFKIWFYYNYAY